MCRCWLFSISLLWPECKNPNFNASLWRLTLRRDNAHARSSCTAVQRSLVLARQKSVLCSSCPVNCWLAVRVNYWEHDNVRLNKHFILVELGEDPCVFACRRHWEGIPVASATICWELTWSSTHNSTLTSLRWASLSLSLSLSLCLKPCTIVYGTMPYYVKSCHASPLHFILQQ